MNNLDKKQVYVFKDKDESFVNNKPESFIVIEDLKKPKGYLKEIYENEYIYSDNDDSSSDISTTELFEKEDDILSTSSISSTESFSSDLVEKYDATSIDIFEMDKNEMNQLAIDISDRVTEISTIVDDI